MLDKSVYNPKTYNSMGAITFSTNGCMKKEWYMKIIQAMASSTIQTVVLRNHL